MKIQEVIDRLLRYHPSLPEGFESCDGYKCGDPEAECTGIAVSLVPTVDAIRRAHEAGCNLLYVHEPTNYTSPDRPGWDLDFDNRVFEAKAALLRETGITIWRDHDRMHAHRPDSIFAGVIRYLGWEDYYRPEDRSIPMGYVFELPETTVGELAAYLMEKLPMNGVRLVGRAEDRIRRVAITGHLLPDFGGYYGTDENGVWHEYGTEVIRGMESGVDVIIPGEVIEWTALSYVRDAVALGFVKAVVNIGHFNMEELGMLNARDYLTDLVEGQVPVVYLPGKDLYSYLKKPN